MKRGSLQLWFAVVTRIGMKWHYLIFIHLSKFLKGLSSVLTCQSQVRSRSITLIKSDASDGPQLPAREGTLDLDVGTFRALLAVVLLHPSSISR